MFRVNVTQGKYWFDLDKKGLAIAFLCKASAMLETLESQLLKLFTFFAGVLAPKQKKEVSVSFRTDEARVIIATIVLKVTEGSNE